MMAGALISPGEACPGPANSYTQKTKRDLCFLCLLAESTCRVPDLLAEEVQGGDFS